MIISAIVAMSQNRVIGKHNKIPWYLPADLKYFKRTTIDHHIILGRKCYESIGRPLPKRTNIIITRNKAFEAEGCVVVNSIEDALRYSRNQEQSEVFIVGGGQIYEQSMKLWDRLYLTEVETEVDGDIYFPKIDDKQWLIVNEKHQMADENNPYNYTFKVYERRK